MRRRASKSGLFLLEMTLVIFFFAIVSAVYVQVFAKAHTLEKESRQLTEATLIAQNMAETFYACDGDLAQIGAALNTVFQSAPDGRAAQQYLLYYDTDWQALPSAADDALAYTAAMTVSDDQPYTRAEIIITDEKGTEIYTLYLKLTPRTDTRG